MSERTEPLLRLLERFQREGVRYILVGGHAVRLNGFLRSTEDIDILLPSSIENGERVIKALNFLPSASELDPNWFASDAEEPENIRVADDLLIDLLFAANGETYESLQPHVRELTVQGVAIRTLDIEGLLKTKTNFRDKDVLDRQALLKILADLKAGK
ncbi:MAG: nucleotidyltransferase family protein [Betaproteobacteria bacterium]|nr:nucleotidyltransferase family protein [Betaproteobacteria bacterium]